MTDSQTIMHGTCLQVSLPEGDCGVLITGPSGSGKSDVALRLIDGGAILISDDQTVIRRDGDVLLAEAPEPLRGLLEVHGLGVFRIGGGGACGLSCVFELTSHIEIERMPEPATTEILGLKLPVFKLCAEDASAPVKLKLMARTALDPALLLE